MGWNDVERLGTLIERCEERNTKTEYTVDDVRGISNEKEFMRTKADLDGRSLTSFQIVHPQDFAFNRRTTRMGEKIAVGFNESERAIIVTEDYVVFRVRETDRLLPAFLFLYLNRAEFDRYARWDSWGSATEFFNWENMCAVPIRLPSMVAQRKAVAIYRGLKENLATQEAGLVDLKLTCDGYLEDLRRHVASEKLAPYIHRVDVRNGKDGTSNVMGISVYKKFREPSTKVDKSHLENYKVVKPRQISFVQTTHNEHVFAYAMNDTNEDIVTSSVNEVFYTDEEKLLPEYLCMWFNRTEFDRYARYHSWGTVRETFTWDDLTKVEIPIPTMRLQKSVSDIYRCYIERQRIADALRQQLKDICPILVRGAVGDLEVE